MAGVAEGIADVAGRSFVARTLLYDLAPADDYATYRSRRDPLLGWPPKDYRSAVRSDGTSAFDDAGSRVVPAYPDPRVPACVALFGDSYTWGDEVGPEDTWGNRLAEKLRCRVANFGVGGYGTDQALLRYRSGIAQGAGIVVLGHFSENIVRNVNQQRGFIGAPRMGLKPRFLLRDGKLVLVPVPELDEKEFNSLGVRGREILPHDHFAPGAAGGVGVFRFPYVLALIDVVRHYRVQAAIRGKPAHAAFYDPGHGSGSAALTEAILREFAAEAARRQQRAMVVFIPDVADLRQALDGRAFPFSPLADRLRTSGIEVPDLAGKLLKDLGDRNPCVLYTKCGGGHFTAETNRRVGEFLAARLVELGWQGRAD